MFNKVVYNSHQVHNPSCDIVEGHLDGDSFLTYGEYVNNPNVKFIEYYSGENYVVGSKRRSHSRHWLLGEEPKKWSAHVAELRKLYSQNYKQ
jgi:hypothetical protein